MITTQRNYFQAGIGKRITTIALTLANILITHCAQQNINIERLHTICLQNIIEYIPIFEYATHIISCFQTLTTTFYIFSTYHLQYFYTLHYKHNYMNYFLYFFSTTVFARHLYIFFKYNIFSPADGRIYQVSLVLQNTSYDIYYIFCKKKICFHISIKRFYIEIIFSRLCIWNLIMQSIPIILS